MAALTKEEAIALLSILEEVEGSEGEIDGIESAELDSERNIVGVYFKQEGAKKYRYAYKVRPEEGTGAFTPISADAISSFLEPEPEKKFDRSAFESALDLKEPAPSADTYTDRAVTESKPAIASMTQTAQGLVQAIVSRDSSDVAKYKAMQSGLVALYPDMSAVEFGEVLAQAIAAAELAGRWEVVKETTSESDFAEPTKRVLNWNGLKIGITHEAGDTRHGTEMRSPYGRLYRSYGQAQDGKAIDFYVVDESGSLFKIRQLAEDGTVDEVKYAIAPSLQEARDAYLAHVPRDRFGGIELADPEELSAYSYEEEEDAIALKECGASYIPDAKTCHVGQNSQKVGRAVNTLFSRMITDLSRDGDRELSLEAKQRNIESFKNKVVVAYNKHGTEFPKVLLLDNLKERGALIDPEESDDPKATSLRGSLLKQAIDQIDVKVEGDRLIQSLKLEDKITKVEQGRAKRSAKQVNPAFDSRSIDSRVEEFVNDFFAGQDDDGRAETAVALADYRKKHKESFGKEYLKTLLGIDEQKGAIAQLYNASLESVNSKRLNKFLLGQRNKKTAASYEEDAIALNERELELDWAADFAEVGIDFAETPTLPDPRLLSPEKLKQVQTAVVKQILQSGDRGYKGRIDEIVFENGNPMKGLFSDRRTRPVKVLRYEITTTSKSFSPVSGFELDEEGDR